VNTGIKNISPINRFAKSKQPSLLKRRPLWFACPNGHCCWPFKVCCSLTSWDYRLQWAL